MTEQTIRSMAVELAGAFYETTRTKAFRAAFPTVKAYLGGWRHLPDGRRKKVEPGWMHHVVLARKLLAGMLSQSDARISPAMKERIYDALKEDRGKSLRFGKKFTQRMEREDYGKKSPFEIA